MMGRGRKELKKKVAISSSDKIKLADLVKNYAPLWSLADPNHRKGDKLLKCWEEIGKEMKLSAEVCKHTWKSMKDALRYRQGSKPKQCKSGDSAPEDSDDDRNSENLNKTVESWEFWDCMKFLIDQKGTRKTISSLLSSSEVQIDGSNEAPEPSHFSGTNDEAQSSSYSPSDHGVSNKPSESLETCQKRKSNYGYAFKKKILKPSEEVTEKLASGITDLINLRKESQQTRNEKLEFHSMFVNLDRMLKTLPADVVEDLNMEFVNLTYAAMKYQKSKSG
ncbi:unnamed protein product [Orchesella dallaii]|uniref:MADF domain-containing protein n=1 Tax=Orchesella dallaii TaxID=48710 RepID=A0ABP1Q9C7_9HEXA